MLKEENKNESYIYYKTICLEEVLKNISLESLLALEEQYDSQIIEIKKHKQDSKQKLKIKNQFLDTQKLILTSYFDNAINLAYSPKLIENYRNKLYLFKNIIGQVEGDSFYNDYYIDKMVELEKRYELKNAEITDLVIVKHNFISKLVRKLKTLFGFNPDYAEIRDRN